MSKINFITICAVLVSLLVHKHASSQAISQRVGIQQFPPLDVEGNRVTQNLPLYKLHVAGGQLVDDAGNVFNSLLPQTTTPTSQSGCTVLNPRWAAYYTTFYVVLASDPTHLYLTRSCGKSPLQFSGQQYPNISDQNFINHAQMAGSASGQTSPQVIAAGEIDVVNGKIVYIDNCSGHFKPNVGSMVAYMNQLDGAKAISLTSNLKDYVSANWITDQQINASLIYMKQNTTLVPKRDERPGTGGCFGYTTVFTYSVSTDLTTTLSGGLLAYQQGNINIFQSDINTITNKNIKSIELTNNVGWYDYNFSVVPDWHFINNSLDFYFTDESPETYELSIHISILNHQTDYDSPKPNINKITFK